jgi:hypothetical protein
MPSLLATCLTELAFLHETFEKAFCSKLQRSGSANFANVSDCSFRFIYDPVSFADISIADIVADIVAQH